MNWEQRVACGSWAVIPAAPEIHFISDPSVDPSDIQSMMEYDVEAFKKFLKDAGIEGFEDDAK
jgi:hypothetical protein